VRENDTFYNEECAENDVKGERAAGEGREDKENGKDEDDIFEKQRARRAGCYPWWEARPERVGDLFQACE
jgi:hypothetical protein